MRLPVDVSKATLADLGALQELARECAGVPVWSELLWQQTLQSALPPQRSRIVLLAALGPEPVGFAVLHMIGDEGELESLGVAPDARRCGVGMELCEALFTQATELGVKCVRLEVRASNEAALALYSRLGFARTGRRPRYYETPQEDALLLEKPL